MESLDGGMTGSLPAADMPLGHLHFGGADVDKVADKVAETVADRVADMVAPALANMVALADRESGGYHTEARVLAGRLLPGDQQAFWDSGENRH